MRTFHSTLAALLLLSSALLIAPATPARAAGTIGSGTPASCSFVALKEAIASGGEITFNCGSSPHTISFAETIELQNTVTLDGGGKITLGGNGRQLVLQRSFDRTASLFTLRNLTISGGRASGAGDAANGGAIRSVNNSFDGKSFPQVLTIENVTFSDNDTNLTSFNGDAYDFGGGAIYSIGGRVVIKNSSFRDNDAVNSAGGAIHMLQSALSIESTSFTNNTALGKTPADSLGGAIYIDGLGLTDANASFTLTGSVFENNKAYNAGGAIYINTYENTNSLVIEQTRFSNNAVVAGNRAQGGAIGGGGTNSSPRVAISRSLFNGNTAKSSNDPFDGSGGALSFAQTVTLRIENSTFVANRAEGTGKGYNANGGALYIVNHSTPFEIVSSTFANNFAGWVGGAISSSDTGGSLRNTLFSNNTATGIANFQQHCSNELTDSGGNFQFPGRLTGDNYYNDVTCFKEKSKPDQKNDPVFRDPKLAALADNGGSTQTMAI
ncbi:MAG: hypothetical protein H7Z42_11355, partial [Roseiflexaceae bacterium]|nr:hypothetical protein [Roseiflexaceae bacterium]